MHTHSNIKVDKAAIVKQRIYPPPLSQEEFRLFCKSRCILQISLIEGFPQGRREGVLAPRIQTAAQGVNDFVKAM
jgi:hypothetical protein